MESGLLPPQYADMVREDAVTPFVKMHGLRNHFIIIDARAKGFDAHERNRQSIRRLCDGASGVGCDEFVVIEASRDNGCHAYVRFFNVDGHEVEACGNATRCVAWLLMEEASSDTVFLQTMAGVLECVRVGSSDVRVDMGVLSGEWQRIPLCRPHDTLHGKIESGPLRDPVLLSIGNPHAVCFVDNTDDINLLAHAPMVQNHELFTEQVNVEAAHIIDRETIRMIVYERPGIITQACGSGACATAQAARLRGLVDEDKPISVIMDGGMAVIDITSDNRALMTGPTAFCFAGWLPMTF